MKTSMGGVCDDTAPTEALSEKQLEIMHQARESPIILCSGLSEAVSIDLPGGRDFWAEATGEGVAQTPLSRLVPWSECIHGDEQLSLKFKDGVRCQSVLKS